MYSPIRFLIIVAICLASSINVFASGEPEKSEIEEQRTVGEHLTYNLNRTVNNGEDITIEFWSQIDYEPIYSQLVEDYEKLHPNVNIELRFEPWDSYRRTIEFIFQSELAPDIIHLHNSLLNKLLPHLEPYPENLFPLQALDQDFYQVRSHLQNGYLYYINTGLMTGAILYNKEHWQEAGLDETAIPQTWEELYELAQVLTRYTDTGRVIRSGFNPNGLGFPFLAALNLQQGVPLFSLEDPRKPLLSIPETVRSLEYMRRFYREPKLVDIRMPFAHESFAFGSSSMIYAWGWILNWLEQSRLDLEYGVFRLPSWDGNVPVAWDRNNGEISMGVSRNSDARKKAVAFDIIKFFLSNDSYLTAISKKFALTSSKKSLQNIELSQELEEQLAPFQQILDRTVWPGNIPLVYEEHVVKYIIEPVIIDNADLATALRTASAIVTPIMLHENFFSRESLYKYRDEVQENSESISETGP